MDQNYYDEVRKFYDRKAVSYDSKYLDDNICHIHTGLFESKVGDEELVSSSAHQLKEKLIMGQNKVFSKLAEYCEDGGHFLDVGAGHGGNSIALALQKKARMDAITISPVQANIIRERVEIAGLNAQVKVIKKNVLDHEIYPNLYTGAFGVESFCQIGQLDDLAKILHKGIKPGGHVTVLDYYTSDPAFKAFFDKYWCCSIFPLAQFKTILESNGFEVKVEEDLTQLQAPFWKISAWHSKKLLESSLPKSELQRLKKSQQFHEFMYDKFVSEEARYFLIHAVKK